MTVAWVALPYALHAAPPGPVFSDGGPDAAAYGQMQKYPFKGGTGVASEPDQLHVVGASTHFADLFPTHSVAPAPKAWQFKRPAAEPKVEYLFHGQKRTLDDFLASVPATGLLIVKDDTILAEHYQYARTDHDRFIGNSVTKSLISMLMGIAVADGRIASVDDKAEKYVGSMKGSAYGGMPLRTLLQMSSGMVFDEKDGTDAESGQLWSDLFTEHVDDGAALAKFKEHAAAPDTRFHYSCGDNETLTTVLRHAVNEPLAKYLDEKIWKPIGAEGDAAWGVDSSDQETGCYGFSATLRDYGRLGRLLAHDGAWNGHQLIPRQWLLDATTVRATDKHLAPGTAARYYGYGYQLWILPGDRRMFALLGASGQYVFVDPKSKLVLVQTAVRVDDEKLTSPKSETLALWQGVVQQFGD